MMVSAARVVSGVAVLGLCAAAAAAPPQVTQVQPDPLSLGNIAEVVGSDFAPGATTIAIGSGDTLKTQEVVNIQASRVRFVVDEETALGSQSLWVQTPDGNATITVTVAPPRPLVEDVAPDQLVLGELVSMVGEHLDGVTSVSLGGVDLNLTEQTPFVIVAKIPFLASLLGPQPLVADSLSGAVTTQVTVTPPPPRIDAIAPNPVRQGDLVEIRGQILPLVVQAHVGLVQAQVLDAAEGVVTILVPDDVPIGPHDVTVTVNGVTSPNEGPLYVEAADPNRPNVDGIYPVNVAKGGEVWLVGQNLDLIETASHGLDILACDRTSCQLGTGGARVGEAFTAAISGRSGTALFTMQVIDQELVEPRISQVTPQPAFRGQELTITGERLDGVRTAVIGGQAQSITFFDATTVTFTVNERTPLGAERLFLAGVTASEPVTVTILEPFPDEDAGADVTGDTAGGDVGPDTGSAADTGGGDRGSDDCAGAPGTLPLAWVLALLIGVLLAARRRTARQP